jgi:hypothetical protein
MKKLNYSNMINDFLKGKQPWVKIY